jgi:hypothetical protein
MLPGSEEERMKMLFILLGCSFSLGVLLPSCASPVPSEDTGASSGSQGAVSGGSHSGGTAIGSGGNPNDEVCVSLKEAECNATEVCRPLFGGLITPNKAPWEIHPGTEAYLGCRYGGPANNEFGCGSAIVCGYDPGGSECWTFRNTCIPNGWTLLNCFDERCPFLEGDGGAGGAN